MTFELTDEQVSLRDSVKTFFATKSTSEVVRKAMGETQGFDASINKSVCDELGLTSLIVSEAHGGFGASDFELNLAMYEHGYYLAPTPLRTHSYATMLVQECASDEVKSDLLAMLAGGNQVATVAIGSTVDLTNSTLQRVTQDEGSSSLTFEHVLFGNVAKHFFYVDNNNLYHIDLEENNVEREAQNSIDPTQPISILKFDKSKAEMISHGDISDSYKIAKARMTILLANEMLGGANASFEMALEYSKDREQFGKAIGSFQVIKHMLADMYIDLEKAKSLCLYGAYVSSIRGDDLVGTSDMAKAYMSDVFNLVTRENIQIHGGIGFTHEHYAHLYLKRAVFATHELGDASEHLEAIAQDIFS